MRALALFSGGLDSMIAVRLIKDQGIDVMALFIDVGFGSKDDKSDILRKRANIAGGDFDVINTREQFIKEILFNPKYGYGKNFNPCIDCHGNMVKIAKALLPKYGASFIVTGEVLGQRPMSQRKEAILNVTSLAEEDEDGLILRPLSAKKLKPTIPEKNGWVDREKLLGISGRQRDVQLELAKIYEFDEFESPGGGCLLTDIHFANKMKEHLNFGIFENEDVEIFKIGRHFRLPDGAKLVVARNEQENEKMKKIQDSGIKKYDFIELDDFYGPYAFISKESTQKDLSLGAKIFLTYGKSEKENLYDVKIGKLIVQEKPLNSKIDAHIYLIN